MIIGIIVIGIAVFLCEKYGAPSPPSGGHTGSSRPYLDDCRCHACRVRRGEVPR